MKFTTPVTVNLNSMPARFPNEFENSVRGVSYEDNFVERLISDDTLWRKEMPDWNILFKMLAEQMVKEGLDITKWRLWDAGNIPLTEDGDTEGSFGFDNWPAVKNGDQLEDENFDVSIEIEDDHWVMTVFAQDADEDWVGQDCESIRDVIALWEYEFED